MASYYDSYDARSRTYETPRSRSTIDSYLRPDAALGSSHSSDKRSRSRSRARSPDSRNSYPPLLSPDTSSRRSHRSRSRSRRRNSWPPAPTCEDEAASLAKEADSQLLLKDIAKDEAVLRGTVDQEPIVLDVSQLKMPQEKKIPVEKQHSRTPSSYSGVPTPPPSDDERARSAAARPSKLSMNFDDIRNDVPELSKRTASPYSFSKDTGLAREAKQKPRVVSSEKLMSPPSTDPSSRSWKASAPKAQAGTPTRELSSRTPTARSGSDYFSLSSLESAIDDTDGDASDAASRYSRRKPSTYPAPAPTKTESPRSGLQSNVVDFAPSTGLAPPRRLNLDARRNTDVGSGSTPPTLLPKLDADKARRPTPLMTTTTAFGGSDGPGMYASPVATHATLDIPSFSARNPSNPSSRNVSPSNSSTGKTRNMTPPETPRTSSEFFHDPSMDDSPISRNSSVSNSRPSSPSPRTPLDSSRFPKTDMDWSAALAANTARRSKPTPRIAAIRQETMPITSRDDNGQMPINSPVAMTSRSSSLPYPVDDGPSTPTVWMPAEQHHQYYPDPRPIMPYAPLVQEPKSIPRTSSPSVGSLPSASYSHSSRPSTSSRQSTIDQPRQEKPAQPEKSRSAESKRVSSFNNPSQAKKDLPNLVKKGLPECSRTKAVAGYNDWYCLTSTTSLDFCPDCIDHIDRTAFRLSFRRSPPRSSSKKVMCALGGMPWIRLAFLLTLHRQLTSLELLEKIANVEDATDPCPGDQPCAMKWYGLKDRDGYFVRDFGICYNDVKKIETLLPALNNLFVPLPRRGSSFEKGICAIRHDGNRFPAYLDSLIATHETAQSTRRPADPSAFIELVKRRQRLRECSRDYLFQNHMWHFIPSVPHMTVCEDCFETVIEPQIKAKSSVACQFNRAIAPVYGSEGLGVSCQLYSPRMRSVFAKAVQRGDLRYLARKARERREAELRLQGEYSALVAKGERMRREGAAEEEWARLEREKRKCADSWLEYE